MADFKKEKYQYYFENGLDVPIKLSKTNKQIYVKPVLVKDSLKYNEVSSILKYDKNKINDIDVIRMSYLEYLAILVLNSEQIATKFMELMKLCLGLENIAFNEDKGAICIAVVDGDNNVESVIHSNEFDTIKNVILYQNDSDYVNLTLSEDLLEQYETYINIVSRDTHTPTTEEKKAYIMLKNGYTLEQINNLPLRFFELMYKTGIDNDEYIAQKIIQGSFKYDIKNDIVHPQYAKRESPIKKLFADRGDFEQKLAKGGII